MTSLPLLPQNDPNLAERTAQLQQIQQEYQYNYTYIPPLPMAEKLPFAELPSLKWLLLVGDAALKLMLNTLQGKHEDSLLDHLQTYSTFSNLLKQNNPQDVERRLKEVFTLIQSSYTEGEGLNWDEYKQIFQSIPLPAISQTFMEDTEFAWLRVAGPNPLVIQRVNDSSQLFWITDSQYQTVMPKDTLAQAVAQGRLYLADYSVLRTVEAGSYPQDQKYLSAPLALFAVKAGILTPVAIQLSPGGPLFTPTAAAASTQAYWTWLMAKTIVQIADANYHELISHLGRTHLLVEPFVLATHRQLAPNHPLNLLLTPHFEGTLSINDAAQKYLAGPGDPVDALLAGTIDASRTLTVEGVQSYVFNHSMLPDTFRQRGVEDPALLPDYPYRDDGLLVWNAIHQWVSDYLSVYYQDDTDLEHDTELQHWVKELLASDGGRMAGFGENGSIQTRAYLINAVTLIIFTSSAQHAAVNFSQASLMSYAPAMPMAGYTPPPTSSQGATEEDYFKLLPPISQAQGQLSLTYLLGTVYYTKLGDYSTLVDPRIQTSLRSFQDQLQAVETTIKARNEDREHRYAPYTYLRPSLIPQSINI
ncbi:lipoxygenase family protein [Anthocerotibacter panamensis]|uniref:lipoxygenase family protein n=1 Tax=Anthocerotibacter panamensis TaxID=2857077 RepID=UPI001C40356A|nr:lipoxygenase family protein [Anthocerotibacter panamensis]